MFIPRPHVRLSAHENCSFPFCLFVNLVNVRISAVRSLIDAGSLIVANKNESILEEWRWKGGDVERARGETTRARSGESEIRKRGKERPSRNISWVGGEIHERHEFASEL